MESTFLTITIGSVTFVAILGVSVFFWWRARYGVWSKRRRHDDNRTSVVIKDD